MKKVNPISAPLFCVSWASLRSSDLLQPGCRDPDHGGGVAGCGPHHHEHAVVLGERPADDLDSATAVEEHQLVRFPGMLLAEGDEVHSEWQSIWLDMPMEIYDDRPGTRLAVGEDVGADLVHVLHPALRAAQGSKLNSRGHVYHDFLP